MTQHTATRPASLTITQENMLPQTNIELSGSSTQNQWIREREYFNQIAASAGSFNIEIIAPRYEAAMARPLYPLEVAYALLGEVRGKRILDVGCGHGDNSLLFARWGAHVTGVDVSGGAIAVCRRRAAELGLTNNTSFVESPVELLQSREQRFDIIWSAAFLHHVLDRLDSVAKIFASLLSQDGFVLFLEPVRFSEVLKAIRAVLPISRNGTKDERPLERGDLAILQRLFKCSNQRYFGPMSRIAERFGSNVPLETASRTHRTFMNTFYQIDHRIMRLHIARAAAMVMTCKLELSQTF